MAERRRISIGFYGGGALAAKVTEDSLSSLRSRLGQEGWHELEAEDGTVVLDLSKVIYLLVDSTEPRVGFG